MTSTTPTAPPSTTTSSSSSFFKKLTQRIETIDSHLCIGLDPHRSEILPPSSSSSSNAISLPDAAYTFCHTLIASTLPHAAAYKPNLAFFEALGVDGIKTLERVLALIPDEVPILLDAKRGDIGSTATAYAQACFELGGREVEAVTVNPLMGWDAIEPFVTGTYSDKTAFILCKTSNPTSSQILSLPTPSTPLYHHIATLTRQYSSSSSSSHSLGLVVGATDPTALRDVRNIVGNDVWILAPGIGAQGGDLEEAWMAGCNEEGSGLLIPVSRGVSRSKDPGGAAEEMKNDINTVRTKCLSLKREQEKEKDEESELPLAPYQKSFLDLSIKYGVLKFGSFRLKSGRSSPYFFNAGLFSTGGALAELGTAYAVAIMSADELRDDSSNNSLNFDVIFGPAYKGISLGVLVCASLYAHHGVDVGFAYNRKEVKDHGEGGSVVGAELSGQRVLIVDDVITAGTSIRESYDSLTTIHDAKPTGVVIALDRAEKRELDDLVSAVQAVARDLGLPVVSIVSLPQLQIYLKDNDDGGVVERMQEYRERYGV